MRQAGGAEHQGEAQGQEVDLRRQARAVLQTGLEERLALAGVVRGRAEEGGEVEVELDQHQHHDQGRADHEHDGLDDLDVGRALHAADHDVEDHQRADPDDRDVLHGLAVHAEEQRDERACADHLGEQVEDRHDHRRDGCRGAHGALAHPERQLVGHRVATGVAEHLRDQQQGDEPGHEEADRVEEAVVAVEGDGARDAEERRRGHVVAADGETVLEAREGSAAGVEVGRRLGLPTRPEGDGDGQRDDGQEQDRGEDLGVHQASPPLRYSASSWRASGSSLLVEKRE